PPSTLHTLSLHDALPISRPATSGSAFFALGNSCLAELALAELVLLGDRRDRLTGLERIPEREVAVRIGRPRIADLLSSPGPLDEDRKSTRLNSSHVATSY